MGPAGPKGDSGVYIGPTEPADAFVWIDELATAQTVEAIVREALGVIENGTY